MCLLCKNKTKINNVRIVSTLSDKISTGASTKFVCVCIYIYMKFIYFIYFAVFHLICITCNFTSRIIAESCSTHFSQVMQLKYSSRYWWTCSFFGFRGFRSGYKEPSAISQPTTESLSSSIWGAWERWRHWNVAGTQNGHTHTAPKTGWVQKYTQNTTGAKANTQWLLLNMSHVPTALQCLVKRVLRKSGSSALCHLTTLLWGHRVPH